MYSGYSLPPRLLHIGTRWPSFPATNHLHHWLLLCHFQLFHPLLHHSTPGNQQVLRLRTLQEPIVSYTITFQPVLFFLTLTRRLMKNSHIETCQFLYQTNHYLHHHVLPFTQYTPCNIMLLKMNKKKRDHFLLDFPSSFTARSSK